MKHIKSIKVLLLLLFFCLTSFQVIYAQQVGEIFPSWQEGYLDIHHINTGMGDCTFFVFPDGTTMLFDAGEMDVTKPRMNGPRNAKRKPNASKLPGEWLVNYIQTEQKGLKNKDINYAAISHFHDDHMGNPHTLAPKSKSGTYKLTGITTIGENILIKKLIDRGWPSYDYPSPLNNPMMQNYRAFIDWQIKKNDMIMERFVPGKNNQIELLNKKESYPNFEIRNVSVNGEVWTGVANNTRSHFPELESLKNRGLDLPSENPCSISFRVSYGQFDYFTGGDIPGILEPNEPIWNDIETPVAKAVGPVEVNVLNHHGNRDSQNAFFLEALQPRVHIMSVWSSDHPGHDVLRRLLNETIYPGPRDIFATNMLDANFQVIGSSLEKLKSTQGHIVVRVQSRGDIYQVFILEDSDTSHKIKSVYGPYSSR
ncbi:MAG: MBL fold metallo-hydrolase [Cyclobacteriaceae bacterium]